MPNPKPIPSSKKRTQSKEQPKKTDSKDQPKAPIFKALTDLGNAERFLDRYINKIRFCPESKKWMIFHEGRWLSDNGTFINSMAHDTVRQIIKESEHEGLSPAEKAQIANHAAKSASNGRIKAMIDLAKWLVPISSDAFDRDPLLLNCINGTLNLRVLELKPHDPRDLITKKIPVPFDPKAKCPIWESSISACMGNDKEKISFVQRVLGLALTGVTTEQCLFVLHGPGANGKSTILETMRELMADYAMHTTTASLLQSRGSRIRNDLARLNSARLVSAVEIGMGKKLDEALVKQLTGGDQVTARFLYNEFFEFKPKFKLFISANHKPEIRGVDHGIWRRIHLIPFNVTIPSDAIDKALPLKLKTELPGILAWAVRGCVEWQENGLNVPESISVATSDYRDEMDILSGFIEDKCTRQPSDKVQVGDLYEAYKKWSDLVCQETVGKKIFGNLMRQKGFTQSKSDSIRYWKGIKLNSEVGSDEHKVNSEEE